MRVVRRVCSGVPDASARSRSIQIGQPEHSVVTTCAASAAPSRRRCAARRSCAWCPTSAQANRGSFVREGSFAWGYATHKERQLKAMVRERITDPWRETTWEEAIGRVAPSSRASRDSSATTRSAASPHRAARTKRRPVQKLIRAGFGVNNVDTCARVVTRPPATGSRRLSARLPARRTSTRLRTAT